MAVSIVGFAVAFSVMFSVTSLFCITRFYIDIERHWRTPSKTHLASLFSFFLGWAFFTIIAGVNFWKINEALQITLHGRKAMLFVPLADVDYPDIYKAEKLTSGVAGFALVSALWAVKVSLFLMNYKLRSHLSRKLKYALIVLAVYLLLTYIGNMLVDGLSCHPISKSWNAAAYIFQKKGVCESGTSHLAVGLYTALNISSDLFVMGLPIFIIKDLQLNRRDKWAFSFLLFLGICTISASAMRSVLTIRIGNQLQEMSLGHGIINSSDSHLTQVATYLEISVALVAASLPSIRLKVRWMSELKTAKRPKRKEGLRTIGGSGDRTDPGRAPHSQPFHEDTELTGEFHDDQMPQEQSDHSLTFLTMHELGKYNQSTETV